MKRDFIFIIVILLLVISTASSQWLSEVRLTNNPFSQMTSYNNGKFISAANNYVHLVWYDDRDGNYEIYYRNSTNYGLNWNSETRVSNGVNSSDYPCLLTIGNSIYVAFEDLRNGNYEIYFNRSLNNGLTWSGEQRLTNSAELSEFPSLAYGDGYLHMVWQDRRFLNYDIFYKRSNDGGLNWETDLRLTTDAASSKYASVYANGPLVHIVWSDNRDANNEIYYKRSSDAGNSWSGDIRLTGNSSDSDFPCIEGWNSTLWVVWHDNRDGNYEIYMKRSTNNGVNWEADQRITSDAAISMTPAFRSQNNYLHICWEDTRDLNSEQYYKRSSDGGLTWSADTRLTNSIGISTLSSIALWGSYANVVWLDSRDGNNELYAKRNVTANPPSAPNLILPPNFSTGQSVTPLMDWDSLSVSSSYRIQFTLDSLFFSTWWDTSGVGASQLVVPPAKLLPNTKYWWRVCGINASGTGPYSAIWSFRTGVVNIQQIGIEVPQKFRLYQNHPNPFNPATKINFDLPRSAFVSIKLFDILGREVKNLVNSNLDAGKYTIDLNASELAGGVYFYRIETSEFSDTKKLMLIK